MMGGHHAQILSQILQGVFGEDLWIVQKKLKEDVRMIENTKDRGLLHSRDGVIQAGEDLKEGLRISRQRKIFHRPSSYAWIFVAKQGPQGPGGHRVGDYSQTYGDAVAME